MIYKNFYNCQMCDDYWFDYGQAGRDSACSLCGEELSPYKSVSTPMLKCEINGFIELSKLQQEELKSLSLNVYNFQAKEIDHKEGTEIIVSDACRRYFLAKSFPDLVSPKNKLGVTLAFSSRVYPADFPTGPSTKTVKIIARPNPKHVNHKTPMLALGVRKPETFRTKVLAGLESVGLMAGEYVNIDHPSIRVKKKDSFMTKVEIDI